MSDTKVYKWAANDTPRTKSKCQGVRVPPSVLERSVVPRTMYPLCVFGVCKNVRQGVSIPVRKMTYTEKRACLAILKLSTTSDTSNYAINGRVLGHDIQYNLHVLSSFRIMELSLTSDPTNTGTHDQIIESVLLQYQSTMQELIRNEPTICSSRLDELHGFHSRKSMISLKDLCNPLPNDAFISIFLSKIDVLFENIKDAHFKTLQTAMLNYAMDEYKSKVNRLLGRVSDEEDQFNASMEEIGRDTIEKCRGEMEFSTSLLQRLSEQIRLESIIFQTQHLQLQSNIRIQRQELISNATDNYRTTMNQHLHRLDSVYTDDEVKRYHNIAVLEEIGKLHTNSNSRTHSANIRELFELASSDVFDEIKINYILQRNDAIASAMDGQVSYYGTEMAENMESVVNESGLNKLHVRVRKNAVTQFREQFSSKHSILARQSIMRLESEIEQLFNDEIKPDFLLQIEELQEVLEQSVGYYNTEMTALFDEQGNCFIPQDTLQQHHSRISNLSLSQARFSDPLKNDELKKRLEVARKQFVDRNDMNYPTTPVIGIDLGTSNSCVGSYKNGKVSVFKNSSGNKLIPSFVRFNGTIVESVGETAKNESYNYAESTIFCGKRFIGKDIDSKVTEYFRQWGFHFEVNADGTPCIPVRGNDGSVHSISAQQFSTAVLTEARLQSEQSLGQLGRIKNAVITVPAYFEERQINATRAAAEAAGLTVLEMLSEPMAAAICYNKVNHGMECKYVLTFDLGGGTFDVAVIKTSRGEAQVVAVHGDPYLGGEDIDITLMNYCFETFDTANNTTLKLTADRIQRCRLKLRCEEAKKALSSAASSIIDIGGFHEGLRLRVEIRRSQFESMNAALFQKTIDITLECLRLGSLQKHQINEILLVGGSTKIPRIKELIQGCFQLPPDNFSIMVNPDHAVAKGAAIRAAQLNGNICRTSPDYQRVIDVVPMSMGIEAWGGEYSIIIPRNTPVPHKRTEQFRTATSQQTSVLISIFQGEESSVDRNTKLGDFYLSGIPPAEAHRETVNVTMEFDRNRILHVSAACVSNNAAEATRIDVVRHR